MQSKKLRKVDKVSASSFQWYLLVNFDIKGTNPPLMVVHYWPLGNSPLRAPTMQHRGMGPLSSLAIVALSPAGIG